MELALFPEMWSNGNGLDNFEVAKHGALTEDSDFI